MNDSWILKMYKPGEVLKIHEPDFILDMNVWENKCLGDLVGRKAFDWKKNGIVIIKRKTKFLRIKVNRNTMLE